MAGSELAVELYRRVDALQARVDALEAALREIAEHPHCQYATNEAKHVPRYYNIGVADGHRCAANIARVALGLPPGS